MKLFLSGVFALLSVPILAAAADSGALPDPVELRLPQPVVFHLDAAQAKALAGVDTNGWVRAQAGNDAEAVVEFGPRMVLQLRNPGDLRGLIGESSLRLARMADAATFILQAPDPRTALREAQRLSALPGVRACYPVLRQRGELHGPYAYQPAETLFNWQWNFENRSANGASAGMDINVRAAWPFSQGKGVTIAVADTGIDMAHYELTARLAGAPHHNFASGNDDAGPVTLASTGAHGTEVAGLAAASLNNGRMVGVAPQASLASWVIFHTNLSLATDEELMDMFQYRSDVVGVENHSWGHVGQGLKPLTALEDIGISNAVEHGRSGRGVVLVRSAGNDRASGASCNDDNYQNDPREIAVGAARIGGRVTTYSEPGACVLVGAPSGDTGFDALFTTDILGTNGITQISFFPPYQDLNDYAWGSTAFSGTSASAPQIAGIAALILAANTNLSVRDVQQILLLSARHFDYADPDLRTNGAGLIVSHNLGFGIPDAGTAVNLARSWTPRPPAITVTLEQTNVVAIPDDGLRVEVSGPGVPPELVSVRTLPSTGPHADTPTPALPLADFGYGTNLAGMNLTNKGALIQRGPATFAQSISNAALAGAAFAIVYNYPGPPPGGDQLYQLGGTDFVPIPAVFIGNTDGEGLKSLFQTNADALAQIRLTAASFQFAVTNTLICEHVGLRLQTDHTLRGDLRITLVSPAGTRSVLQHYNSDTSSGPADWTYYSTHHFLEGTAGTWTAYVADEGFDATGNVLGIGLELRGVPIQDRDQDGLDDFWEIRYFNCLYAQGARDDGDKDGYSNAREQAMGTDPTRPNHLPFTLDLSRWNASIARLSWPSASGVGYQVWAGTNVNSLVLVTNVAGRWPETEWFTPTAPRAQFFRVIAAP